MPYSFILKFYLQADNDLGVLVNLLYSTGEDCQPGTPSYTSIVNEKIISPGKDEGESVSCNEEIARSPTDSPAEEEYEKSSGKSKMESEDDTAMVHDQFPCDSNYIRSLLDRLNVPISIIFECSTHFRDLLWDARLI